MRTSGTIESHSWLWYFKAMNRKVKIESMAFKGNGVGHIDGKVIFVPYTVTGDEVSVEIAEDKKSYSVGGLKEILIPSPWRINPPCPYFGDCGGCQWQHIDPSVHEALKKEILKESLQRLAGLKEIPPLSAVPSPQPYGYRIRIQLKAEGNKIGFFGEKSHRVVEIDRCPIAHPMINAILQHIRKERFPFSGMEGFEINVSPEEGKGILIFHLNLSGQRRKIPFKELLQSIPLLKGIAVVRKKRWTYLGDPTLNVTVTLIRHGWEKTFRLRVSPGSFCQVNLGLNQELIRAVLEFSELKENKRVLDLYAGIGNFTLPLATEAKWVIGIDESKKAIADARFNAERNGVKNCQFISGSVEEMLNEFGEVLDLIVLDPPRAGCKKVVDQMVRLEPEKIVYVSCEPTTLSRDLRLFCERGYFLRKLCLIDMFPQTYHMEVVGLLTH
ncbi:MAG: 23S rRNA (uracil(1939)-C(5))-methyltransferase RlmD [Thermodesulfobacteriota bacterium]|nr:23S rRNA (uracil(1939)-C(5))-methyltransferase RlmD [Thermodesulfobacteriota bacterium]